MEIIKANPILAFNENQLHNVRKALGYEDVNKLKQDIEQLQDWIQKQNHFRVKEFDASYLERWLIANKGSIERTKQRFDRLCTFTNLMPEFLQNFDIRNEFKALRAITNNFVLPKPTLENYRILVSYVTGEDDKDFTLTLFYRYIIVIGHYLLCNDYCFGYEWIVDIRNIHMGIISKLNPVIVHKASQLIVEALAQRIKSIHFISGSKFFDTALSLIKQGLSSKLKERIVIHEDIDGLLEYFTKEQLPKELGGNEKSTKEFDDSVFKELSTDEHMAKVKYMESVATDEAYRLSSRFNEDYSGMPGSFKTLCVD